MDISSAILGAAPNVLAFLAEVLTPVSAPAIYRQIVSTAAPQAARQTPLQALMPSIASIQKPALVETIDRLYQEREKLYQEDVHQIADLVATTAFGASKITMLIPTWIGICVGLVAILSDIVSPLYCVILVSTFITLSGLAGIKYFSLVDYSRTSDSIAWLPVWSDKPIAECISAIIMLANLLMVIAVFCTWWFTFVPSHISGGA